MGRARSLEAAGEQVVRGGSGGKSSGRWERVDQQFCVRRFGRAVAPVVGLNGFAVGASLPGYGWGIYSGAGTELLV